MCFEPKKYDTSSQSLRFVSMFGFFQLRKCDHLRSSRACSACSFKPVYLCGIMIIPLTLKVCMCVSAPTYAGVITISLLSYSYLCRDTSLKARGSFTILFTFMFVYISRKTHMQTNTTSQVCVLIKLASF